jgi:imidazole glycerol phosphate synthase glutamine amidotransferase subunit
MIGIVDYGMGNLGSVTNALRFLGLPCRLVTVPDEARDCRALVLPGVGAFGDCVTHIRDHGLDRLILDWISADRPFLGICVGLQVLFEEGEESPGVPGLGVFPGAVRRFADAPGIKVPQIGWNRVRWEKPDHPVVATLPNQAHFYFVHSFHADCPDTTLVAGTTDYGIRYTSAIARGNLFAVQFHPEKSQALGLDLLRAFARFAGIEANKVAAS